MVSVGSGFTQEEKQNKLKLIGSLGSLSGTFYWPAGGGVQGGRGSGGGGVERGEGCGKHSHQNSP